MNSPVKSRVRWYSLVSILVLLDFVSKRLVDHYFLLGESVHLLPFFSLTHHCNTGAAFSLFTGYTSFLLWFSVAASILFVVLIYRTPPHRFWLGLAFSGILAGALGNLIDRAFVGCVIDFLHVNVGGWSFPVFNFADSFITLGACTWVLVHLRHKELPELELETPDTDSELN